MKKHIGNPFGYALNGLRDTVRTERNFRIHLFSGISAIALGVAMNLSRYEWWWVSLSIVLVLITELFNTTIESLVNLASPSPHPLAKKAKDAAAGAVLLAALFALIIGITIFGPRLWSSLFK